VFEINAEIPLIKLLKTISEQDRYLFQNVLSSPPFRKENLSAKCLTYLLSQPRIWKSGKGAGSSPEKLFIHLYPGEPFTPQRLRRLFMELRHQLIQFISTKTASLIPGEQEQQLKLMRHLLDQNEMTQMADAAENYFASQSEFRFIDPFIELGNLWAWQMKNEFAIHNRQPIDFFEEQSDSLDYFYLCKKLEYIASMLTREKQFQQRHQMQGKEEAIAFARKTDETKFPLVKMWLYVILLEEHPDNWENYHLLNPLLNAHKASLSPLILRQLRGYMFNFLLRAQEPGHPDVYQNLWELMKEMEAEETIFLHGMISPPFFISSIRAACLSGKVEWAREFMRTHAEKVSGAHPAVLLEYLEMMLSYYEGRIYEAWRMTLSFHTQDVRIEIWVRLLQIQICYETDREDDFFRLLKSMRTFLKRHPEAGEKAIRFYTHFVQLCQKLGQTAFNSKPNFTALHALIQKTETAEKFWLLAKCGELSER
jgi:hypothetical protein